MKAFYALAISVKLFGSEMIVFSFSTGVECMISLYVKCKKNFLVQNSLSDELF